jgi:ABC-type molybdate transport system substrate-binding protein
VVATYPIVALAHRNNPGLATAFAAYVRSIAAQRVLRAAGFGP